MERERLITALRRLALRTDYLCCFGCGHEHNCSTHGCAVIRAAVEEIEALGSPPNPPLTVEELRGMDGEPVWIVAGPDWGHWELSEDAEDYLEDRDPDFYGMRHDDPAGKYGLHLLGWLAYRRKPGEG